MVVAAMTLMVERCRSVVEMVLTQLEGAVVVGLQGARVAGEEGVASETGAAEVVTGAEVVGAVTEEEEEAECEREAGRTVGEEEEVPWVVGVVVIVGTRLLEYVGHLGRQS